MRDSIAGLRQKITSAEDLESVVRSMKTIASSSIGQYEKAVHSLDDYYQTVQLGLMACLSQIDKSSGQPRDVIDRSEKNTAAIGVIVFGSDQGLVGQFNDVMAEFVVASLAKLPGDKILWSVGERIQSRLLDAKLKADESFALPGSINSISTLVANILTEMESRRERGEIDKVYIFHHRPESSSIYEPIVQQLLPLDAAWQKHLTGIAWPTNNLPEIMPKSDQTLRAFVREYLFVTLFRACAESLASENASRLAAMQRAEKNIDELQEDLNRTFHRLRQSGIDEELFDVLSGFNTLNH